MKKLFLSLVALSLFAVGCSEDSATDFNGPATDETSEDFNPLAARGSVWDGEIGIEEDGVYKITADEAALKADFTATLKREGNDTTIETLTIIELESSNTPGDKGIMLVGSDGKRTSIGVWLNKKPTQSGSQQLTLDMDFSKSTSCTGCAQGCNLDYLNIDGRKVAYCNENGCDYDCTKGESSM